MPCFQRLLNSLARLRPRWTRSLLHAVLVVLAATAIVLGVLAFVVPWVLLRDDFNFRSADMIIGNLDCDRLVGFDFDDDESIPCGKLKAAAITLALSVFFSLIGCATFINLLGEFNTRPRATAAYVLAFVLGLIATSLLGKMRNDSEADTKDYRPGFFFVLVSMLLDFFLAILVFFTKPLTRKEKAGYSLPPNMQA
eukprot:m.309970 g.309970  ORF g.309970 m.309970 type:complete len:196 (-) comp24091_c0_seq1:77-664(-)